jgi:DNA-binding XRE family transcriptional regulator
MPTIEDRGFETPCVIAASTEGSGYGRVTVAPYDRRKAHIFVWEWVHGEVPAGRELHHRCAQRDCMRLDHLELLTRREHMALDGRAVAARLRGKRDEKLSDAQVRRLRERLVAGDFTQTTAAAELGISKQLVNDIARGRSRMEAGGPLGSARDGRREVVG